MADQVAVEVLDLLVRRGASLATVESLTGGQLAAAVTAVPGASKAYLGGAVTYATRLKVELVGVPEAVLESDGVVSEACARAMAHGVRRLTGATYALATTGVAGPDPQEGKPVGTVFVAVAGPDRTDVRALALAGDRARIQAAACREALSGLRAMLSDDS